MKIPLYFLSEQDLYLNYVTPNYLVWRQQDQMFSLVTMVSF